MKIDLLTFIKLFLILKNICSIKLSLILKIFIIIIKYIYCKDL